MSAVTLVASARTLIRLVRCRQQSAPAGALTRKVALGFFTSVAICISSSYSWAVTPSSKIGGTERVALVVGNAHYSFVGALKNPGNDASDMCAALRSVGFRTTCVVDVDTRIRFRSLIQDLVEDVSEKAVILVYYAGHAVQIDGQNYLIPTEARLIDSASAVQQSLNLSFLMGQLRRTAAYLTVVILDACRNNPLASPQQRLPAGLAEVSPPKDTELFYATAANEAAIDGEDKNGIFTKQLLKHLRDEGTIDDLFHSVSTDVRRDTTQLGHMQVPTRYGSFGERFCLVRCTRLEELEAQRDDATRQVETLRRQVEAGHGDAQAKLDAALKALHKLEESIKKARPTFVPPSL